MSRYILSPAALEDLDSIWLFIAEDNLDAAERVVAELESAALGSRPIRTLGTCARISPIRRSDSGQFART